MLYILQGFSLRDLHFVAAGGSWDYGANALTPTEDCWRTFKSTVTVMPKMEDDVFLTDRAACTIELIEQAKKRGRINEMLEGLCYEFPTLSRLAMLMA